MEAERYKDTVLEKWSGYYTDYMDVDGMRVPSNIEAVWNLKSGDFSYARFAIIEIEFNQKSAF